MGVWLVSPDVETLPRLGVFFKTDTVWKSTTSQQGLLAVIDPKDIEAALRAAGYDVDMGGRFDLIKDPIVLRGFETTRWTFIFDIRTENIVQAVVSSINQNSPPAKIELQTAPDVIHASR
jgi:hypothetical protein